MRVQDPLRFNIGESRPASPERTSANATSFQRIMSTYSKDLTEEHLQKLLEELDQQGKQLVDNPTFAELRKYKDLVKRFMGEVTKNGVGMYETESWDPYAGSKTLKTVQIIDRKLIELTNHVLNQQNSSLSLLERVGEIKGLLINLYT